MNDQSPFGRPSVRQPVFNLPPVITAVLGALIAIHVAREFLLDPNTDFRLVLTFAFIPLRETAGEAIGSAIPGGGARVWTFLTYALLHGDWVHLGFNALWLAAFGSPLAWRFGVARFLLFSAAGAAAGALLHLAIFPHDISPLVGASAAISAHMAGAVRFAFTPGGPMWAAGGAETYRRPALPLSAIAQNSRVLMFVAVWFGLNILFGLPAVSQGIASGAIAWDAHIGGFVAGLLLFPLLDPVRRAPD